MSSIDATLQQRIDVRMPSLPSWLILSAVTLFVGLVFLTSEHRWDRSSLKDYVESAEERAIAAVSGNKLRRFAFFAIAGCGTLLLLSSGKWPALREPLGLCLLLAAGWSFASVLWADSVGFTTKRLFLLLLCSCGALGIASTLSLRQMAILLLCVTAGYAFMGILAEVLQGNFRPWAAGYRFAGTLHPNAQATNCGAMALSALAVWKGNALTNRRAGTRRWRFGAQQMAGCLFISAVVLLLMTKSRTASAAIIMVITIVWATRQRLALNLMLAGSALVPALLLAYAITFTAAGSSVGEAANMGRSDSQGAFNGRLPIWEICLGRVGAHVPIGFGYDGFWTAERIEDISWEVGWSISSVHSEYIELVLGLGVIGLGLYLMVQFLAIGWFWLRYYRLGFGGDALILGLLLIGAVQGFMETGYLHPSSFVPFMTLSGIVRLAFFTDHQTSWAGVA